MYLNKCTLFAKKNANLELNMGFFDALVLICNSLQIAHLEGAFSAPL